jgi:hypothetical protein
MARIAGTLLAAALLLGSSGAMAAVPVVVDVRLAVDLDDDDGDGVADGEQTTVGDRIDCASFEASSFPTGLILRSIAPASAARVLADGAVVQQGQPIPATTRNISIQALAAGAATVDLGGALVRVRAIRLWAIDGDGESISMATSHASMHRTVPDRLDSPTAVTHDPDGLRYAVAGRAEDLPSALRIISRSERGATLQVLADVRLQDAPCPAQAGAEVACRTSAPIRVVGDDVDRQHPLVADRSIRGELGGGILIDAGTGRRQQIRIGGPRRTRVGPIRRYRATLRARLMRVVAHGAPPLGGRDPAALSMVREQIALANSLWGQCGISFGPPDEADVMLVDPPSAMMIGVGCDLGMPASGGGGPFAGRQAQHDVCASSGEHAFAGGTPHGARACEGGISGGDFTKRPDRAWCTSDRGLACVSQGWRTGDRDRAGARSSIDGPDVGGMRGAGGPVGRSSALF